MAVGNGVVADLDLGRRLGGGDHPLFTLLLHLPGPHGLGLARAARDAAEVCFRPCDGLVGVEAADERHRQIVGGVVDVEERQGLLAGEAVKVAGPADDRPRVRRRLPEHGVELLIQQPRWGAVDAEPSLLVDHVALAVELAEDRVAQAVGFHPEPELQLVGRDIDEIDGEILAGARVHSRRALPLVDAVEVVLDNQIALLGQECVEIVDQRLMLGAAVFRLAPVVDAAATLLFEQVLFVGPDPGLERVEFCDDPPIRLRIPGADRLRPLEHHVLEEVRHAGDARRLVHRSDSGDPAGRNVGIARPRDEQEAHSVIEFVNDRVDLLRRRGPRDSEQEQTRSEQGATHGGPPQETIRESNSEGSWRILTGDRRAEPSRPAA